MRYSINWNFKNLSINCEKYVFTGKNGIWTHYEFCVYGTISGLRKRPEQKCWLSDILLKQATCKLKLPKQTTSKLKALQVQAYIQQSFHENEGAKFM